MRKSQRLHQSPLGGVAAVDMITNTLTKTRREKRVNQDKTSTGMPRSHSQTSRPTSNNTGTNECNWRHACAHTGCYISGWNRHQEEFYSWNAAFSVAKEAAVMATCPLSTTRFYNSLRGHVPCLPCQILLCWWKWLELPTCVRDTVCKELKLKLETKAMPLLRYCNTAVTGRTSFPLPVNTTEKLP